MKLTTTFIIKYGFVHKLLNEKKKPTIKINQMLLILR